VGLLTIIIDLAGLIERGGCPIGDGAFHNTAIGFLTINDFTIQQQIALGIDVFLLALALN